MPVSFSLLKVQDQGPGIPRARLSRLFEAYSPGRKSGVSGLGLGLYIAKGVVEAHGGSLRAESRPGEGSTFFVSLPVAAPG